MRVIPYGAAGGVTGSCFLVDTKKSKILIDCGIFQGFSTDASANRIPAGIPIEKLDAVILTHAHLDHSGRLPLLVKGGFSKKCDPFYRLSVLLDRSPYTGVARPNPPETVRICPVV